MGIEGNKMHDTREGFRCLYRVQKYCILSNAHGDHRGSICPQCSRRPKHILRTVSVCGNAQISISYWQNKSRMKVGAFYEATAELKGFHWRNSFAHGTSIGNPHWHDTHYSFRYFQVHFLCVFSFPTNCTRIIASRANSHSNQNRIVKGSTLLRIFLALMGIRQKRQINQLYRTCPCLNPGRGMWTSRQWLRVRRQHSRGTLPMHVLGFESFFSVFYFHIILYQPNYP